METKVRPAELTIDRRTLGEAGGAIRIDDSIAARRRSRGRRVGSRRAGAVTQGAAAG